MWVSVDECVRRNRSIVHKKWTPLQDVDGAMFAIVEEEEIVESDEQHFS
jgi:hypothetical protein